MSKRIVPELIAMRGVQKALDPLDIPDRDRVVNWIRERYTSSRVKYSEQPRVWTLGGVGYAGWEKETILGSAPPKRNESIRVIELEPVIDLLDRLCVRFVDKKDLYVAMDEAKLLVMTYG